MDINSLFRKIKTISKVGLNPYLEGLYNFNNPKPEIECLAVQRLVKCLGCKFYVDEPNELLSVKNDKIVDLNGKMCGNCECILSYLVRQNQKICKKWQK